MYHGTRYEVRGTAAIYRSVSKFDSYPSLLLHTRTHAQTSEEIAVLKAHALLQCSNFIDTASLDLASPMQWILQADLQRLRAADHDSDIVADSRWTEILLFHAYARKHNM